MKRCFLLFLLFLSLFTSCSIDDDSTNFYFEVIPIDSVEVPEEFVLGQEHEILITYTEPNSCYIFNDFIYEIDGNERTVGVVNTVYVNDDCTNEQDTVTVPLIFKATSTETYIFKFFQGEDESGVDQYYIVEVPVAEQ